MKSSISLVVLLALLLGVALPAVATDWTVSLVLHEIRALNPNDTWGEEDLYAEVSFKTIVGTGPSGSSSTFDIHKDGDNHIFPEWPFAFDVSGGIDTTVRLTLQVWEHDSTSPDDHFDIHPDADLDIVIDFKPATQFISIEKLPGSNFFKPAAGPITVSGVGTPSRTKVKFSVSATSQGIPFGDTDGDGFLDSWEIFGIDVDGDGVIDVDLPAMGANPFRKDVFVEIDWMVDDNETAIGDDMTTFRHSHEPWLPALINAWHEFNVAPVTNPPNGDGQPTASGIAFHVDVGTLYSNYTVDFDGDLAPEIVVGPDGNIDLDGDNIPDIGNLGALGTGTAGGGNPLAEDTILNRGMVMDHELAVDSDFGIIKYNNFEPNRQTVFRYCVFGHDLENQALGVALLGFDNFAIALGTLSVETLDVDRNGIPDEFGEFLLGPSGIPVFGPINFHAVAFLHELGHCLGLGHGGGDDVNHKPNYLSIMNYLNLKGIAFDTDGDGCGDPLLGIDYNGDGIDDLRRFIFSEQSLPTLNETQLDESLGIGDAQALTIYSCPIGPSGEVFQRVVAGNVPIDWNCDGDATDNPVQPPTDINNGDCPSENGCIDLDGLEGFDDYGRIADGGLAAIASGITMEELERLESTTIRIGSVPNEAYLHQRCSAPRLIDFENVTLGTVDSQFAPPVTFLNDNERTPAVIDEVERGGLPTQSRDQSLINRSLQGPVPLVMIFDPPQRVVGFYYGWRETGDPSDNFVVLKAFDVKGLPMGELQQPLPADPSVGITNFMGTVAIFPDQRIAKIEVSYEGDALGQRVEIDDLIVCDEIDLGLIAPVFPDQPEFGDVDVTVTVQTALLTEEPGGDGEPGHSSYSTNPLPGIPISWNGNAAETNFTVTRPEGETLSLSAPPGFGGGTVPGFKPQ